MHVKGIYNKPRKSDIFGIETKPDFFFRIPDFWKKIKGTSDILNDAFIYNWKFLLKKDLNTENFLFMTDFFA